MTMMLWVAVSLLCAASLVQCDKCHKIVSSNVGLTPQVGNVEPRTDRVAFEYKKLDADVVCAQEFWHEEDITKVVDNAGSNFPYHYSAIHHDISVVEDPWAWLKVYKRRSACNAVETSILTTRLGFCAWYYGCTKKEGLPKVAECLISNCRSILQSSLVHPECVGCLFINVAHSVKSMLTKCHALRRGFRFNAPGLFILSKKKITSAKFVSYFEERQTLKRGYIEAQIEDVGKVICTHLSSNVGGYFEYDLNHKDYGVQQRVEISKVNKTFQGQDYAYLGDMNTGPEVNNSDPEKTLAPEYQSNYDLLMQMGYKSPYMTMDGRCTYCTSNDLIDDKYPNYVLDHVFFRGDNFDIKSAKRILDYNPNPISDHYAVQVEVCEKN